MELLFRRYFWVINLAFLAAAAFLVAKTANVFTERVMMAPPDMTVISGDHHPLSTKAQQLVAQTLSRLTGIPLPKEPDPVQVAAEAAAAATKDKEDLSSDPVHTGLHAKLWATTVANQSQWSWAVIEDTTAHTKDEYMEGDSILNARILNILDDCSLMVKALRPTAAPADGDLETPLKPCVIVMNMGHREYVDDKEGNGPIAPVAVAVAPVEEPKVVSTGDHKYSIPKSEVTNALNNLNEIAMQARIVPAFKDGVATGFKLFSIRPDSIYSKIGIQNGDVIRRLNGFDINSPDKALEAYQKLKDASHIDIDVERNGSVVTQSYDLTQ